MAACSGTMSNRLGPRLYTPVTSQKPPWEHRTSWRAPGGADCERTRREREEGLQYATVRRHQSRIIGAPD